MDSLPQTGVADDPSFVPADGFIPTPEDETWAAHEFNGGQAASPIPSAPVNGQPVTLAEIIDDEARSYRSQGTVEATFIADSLERLSQLVRWTGATTPVEHDDRMEVWEDELRARWFDEGYAEGLQAARRELSPWRPES